MSGKEDIPQHVFCEEHGFMELTTHKLWCERSDDTVVSACAHKLVLYMHICTCNISYTHTHTHSCTHVCVFACICACACVCACMLACMCIKTHNLAQENHGSFNT